MNRFLGNAFMSRARNFSLNRSVFDVSEEVSVALNKFKPIVALESTIITHGMPFPKNIECAFEVEDVVRTQGAVPATIALINGRIKIGLTKKDIEYLGDTKISKPIKTSRRDFPYILSQNLNGGTTVSGTIIVCKKVGISTFATGGIGGVHRGANETFDISADLTELGRTNVTVISSGVKSILDIAKTLEYLETQGVFVATLGDTTDFPAFYSRASGHQAPYRLKNALEAAKVIKAHNNLQLESGILLAVPVPERYALNSESTDEIISEALAKADKEGVRGKEITPFLLSEIATISKGNSLETNIALIKNNAKIAAEIAVNLAKISGVGDGNGKEVRISSDKRPVIIGGSNLDCVVHLNTDVIKLDGRNHLGRFDYSAGGVGRNMCEALLKLGCRSDFISAIGDDHQGEIILKEVPKDSRKFVKKLPKESTAQCIVVLNKNGDSSFLMGDFGIHKKISPDMIKQHEDLIKNSPLLIIDGNISNEASEMALRIASRHNVPVFYEPTDAAIANRPFTTKYWKAIKYVTPNLVELKEIASYLNIKINNDEKVLSKLEEASNIAYKLAEFIENVIVTLGPQGILIARKADATEGFLNNTYENSKISVRHYPIIEKSNFINVNGAGDCFASGFITALLKNLPENQCVSVGYAAAITALYSQSPVPKQIFDSSHESWKMKAEFVKFK